MAKFKKIDDSYFYKVTCTVAKKNVLAKYSRYKVTPQVCVNHIKCAPQLYIILPDFVSKEYKINKKNKW